MSVDDKIVEKYIKNSGFKNTGHTDHINSVLQCLFSVKPFYCFLLNKKYEKYLVNPLPINKDDKNNNLLYILHKIVKHKNNKEKTNIYIKAMINSIHGYMYDCLTFHHSVLNTMSSILGDYSYLDNLFGWEIKKTCNYCKHNVGSKRAVFFSMTLNSIEATTNDTNLVNIIADFLKQIDENTKCVKCNATIKTDIDVHDVIVISCVTNDKRNKLLYPLVNMKLGSKNYNLIGVICRNTDTSRHNHFTSICKSVFNNKWYKYDEDNVYDVDDITNGSVYALFECGANLVGNDAEILFYINNVYDVAT